MVTVATRIDSLRSVSWPRVPRVISGAPSAVAVTVKRVATSVVPVSVRVSVTGFDVPVSVWPGWSVTDVWLKLAVTPRAARRR